MEPDDPKPTADIQRENPCGYLQRPILGKVTK
jgi:hypothetical protein